MWSHCAWAVCIRVRSREMKAGPFFTTVVGDRWQCQLRLSPLPDGRIQLIPCVWVPRIRGKGSHHGYMG